MILVMIFAWLIFGFLVGGLARAIYPGPQPMSILATTGLGILGSFMGGLIGNLLFGMPILAFHPAGLVGSVIGALVVMAIAGFSVRRVHA